MTRNYAAAEPNLGAQLLRAVPGTPAQLQEATGIGWQTIMIFRAGKRRPNEGNALRLQEVYGIPPESWQQGPSPEVVAKRLEAAKVMRFDRTALTRPVPPLAFSSEPGSRPEPKPPAESPAEASEVATPVSALAEADILMGAIRKLRTDLSSTQMDLGTQVTLLQKLSSMVIALGRLTGDGLTSPRQIVRSPIWGAIERAMVEALEPWPDAGRAVAQKLRELCGEAAQDASLGEQHD